jgi:hypothetical protein
MDVIRFIARAVLLSHKYCQNVKKKIIHCPML